MYRKKIPAPFANITNAEEQSWSFGIKNLNARLLYDLSIDYWEPSMFSAGNDEKYIELPFACLDICSEVLFLPKMILEGAIPNYTYPFYLSTRHIAYCVMNVVLDEGKSSILKKGMCLYGGYCNKVQLFIDILKEEILPLVENDMVERDNVLKEIKLMEDCSKDAPFYLYNFYKLTKHYLGCRYGTGSEALTELLELSFSNNKSAFIDIALERFKAMQDRPEKTIEDIINEKKRQNEIRVKKNLSPIDIPDIEEAKLLLEEEKSQFEIGKSYAKKRIERFKAFDKNGFSVDNLFLKRIRILSEQELSHNLEYKDIIIRNYNSVLQYCRHIVRLLAMNPPEVLIQNSRKDLQQRVDVLIYNLIIYKFFDLYTKNTKK